MKTTPSPSSPRVAVIGSGVAGLAAARMLREGGATAVVFEKSRSLAGRCATRLWNGHVVDSGAQYFTAESLEFRAVLDKVGPEFIRPLTAPIEQTDGAPFPDSPHGPRLYHAQGNNRLGKALAAGLDIRLERTIEKLTPLSNGRGWEVGGEAFAAVICTAPTPQAAVILGMPLGFAEFIPCLTAFVELAGEPDELGLCARRYGLLEPDSATSAPLSWSACENHKQGRISHGKTVLVAQTAEAYSRAHLEDDPASWLADLTACACASWDVPPERVVATWGHRWRYARSREETRAPAPQLPPGLYLAGDSLVKSRVELAYLDGLRAAKEALAAL